MDICKIKFIRIIRVNAIVNIAFFLMNYNTINFVMNRVDHKM